MGVAYFPCEVVDHRRLPGLPDQAGRGLIPGRFQQGGLDGLHAGEHPQPHGVALGVRQVREEARKLRLSEIDSETSSNARY